MTAEGLPLHRQIGSSWHKRNPRVPLGQARARLCAQCPSDFFGFNAQDELQYRGRLTAYPPVADARDLFEAMKQVADTGHGPKEQFPRWDAL
jgi:hypothetical protein